MILSRFHVKIINNSFSFKSEKHREMFKKFLAQFEGKEVAVEIDEKKSTRTSSQNKALHKDCELIAEKLQEAGLDWKALIRDGGIDIPVTTDSVKEFMWKPIQKIMYGKASTKQLEKTGGEIEKIHDVIMRHLAEKHGIEYHEFPNNKKKSREAIAPLERPDIEYPERGEDVKF